MLVLKSFLNKKISRMLLLIVIISGVVTITSFIQLLVNINNIDVDINGGPKENVVKFSLHKINKDNIEEVIGQLEEYSIKYDIQLSTEALFSLDNRPIEESKEYMITGYSGVSYTSNPVWQPKVKGDHIDNSKDNNAINVGEVFYKNLKSKDLIEDEKIILEGKEYIIKGMFDGLSKYDIHVPLRSFDHKLIYMNNGNAVLKLSSNTKFTEDDVKEISYELESKGINIELTSTTDSTLVAIDKNSVKKFGIATIIFCVLNVVLFVSFEMRGRIKFQKVGLLLGLTKKNAINLMIVENIINSIVIYITSILCTNIALKILKGSISTLFSANYVLFDTSTFIVISIITVFIFIYLNISHYLFLIRKVYK
ncbi:MAG: ABC transporter permease [Clostridium sp.]